VARRLKDDTWSYPPEPGDLEPFRLGDGERGVLLIHGFCGTPPEMRGMGEYLAGRGFRVHGAMLAGHGTTPEDLEKTTWRDWLASAEAQLNDLRAECETVCVAGQSMGGTMSLLLAAHHPDIRAVATCAALVNLGRWPELQIAIGRRLVRWHYPDRDRVDLWDREAVKQLRSYNRRALVSHVSLVQLYRETLRAAAQVHCPALVLQGLRDSVVPPANAAMIAAAIGATAEVRYFERSGHAMTVDVDHDEVYALVGDLFERATSEAAPAAAKAVSSAV
jgi:carboxylesterase